MSIENGVFNSCTPAECYVLNRGQVGLFLLYIGLTRVALLCHRRLLVSCRFFCTIGDQQSPVPWERLCFFPSLSANEASYRQKCVRPGIWWQLASLYYPNPSLLECRNMCMNGSRVQRVALQTEEVTVAQAAIRRERSDVRYLILGQVQSSQIREIFQW